MHEQFETQGFLVAKGLLDPERDILPVREAYTRLLDRLLAIYVEESPGAVPRRYKQLSFPERFAILLGASHGSVLHHIDPALNVFDPTFQWRDDLPEPRIPEIFDLIRHRAVIEVLEGHLGPRIQASPIHHVNIKPALKHLKLARQVTESSAADAFKSGFRGFQLGKTRWHMDAIAGLKDSHTSGIVNTWIPMTTATETNGCLQVVPGSHKNGVVYPPYPPDLDQKAVALPMEPGDVVFLDNKLIHSALPNTSKSDYRWAFNFRYLPVGQPNGRPFLPGFVARNRLAPAEELQDARTWAGMWRGCLKYLARNGAPITFENVSELSPESAGEITSYWERLAPDCAGWIRLGKL